MKLARGPTFYLKLRVRSISNRVNLYFMPIFPIGTPLPPNIPYRYPPTPNHSNKLGGPWGIGVFGGDAYVSDIWGLKTLGEFPEILENFPRSNLFYRNPPSDTCNQTKPNLI